MSKKVQTHLFSSLDMLRLTWKNRFFFWGLLFLGLAILGPQIGTRIKPVERKGVDLVFALDTSVSMDATDVKPSRIAKAKFEISRLIRGLKGDRVGIIVFAGSSHLYLPMTTDYEAAQLFLNDIDTQMIPTQGTALSTALETGLSAFTEESEKYKVLILVTDGEDHEGKAIDISRKAAETGMSIYTVGVGSKTGSLIPISNKNSQEYKRDKTGKLITTMLNESILKEIADAGRGHYFRFSNNSDTADDIAYAIDHMEKRIVSTHEFSEYEDRYQIPTLISLILFFIGLVLPTKAENENVHD
ncbi:MAG: VWA domain-containing protein [Candidatus Marinimicrobia bacterium]|jgi:Ca-activated chloride channel family protein|nr:VWA domain-containing protein [Candidatus Neomarinimicrobiota bacterium]